MPRYHPLVPDDPPREATAWWREGVLYQIYPRSFGDSDGDGIGDLRGIIEHLDHLNGRDDSLGVDGIWISPFYPSPMADFGYDVTDYCGVDPTFGTLADFDDLVAAAHARDIRVIVDLVPNHTSDRHPGLRQALDRADEWRRSVVVERGTHDIDTNRRLMEHLWRQTLRSDV